MTGGHVAYVTNRAEGRMWFWIRRSLIADHTGEVEFFVTQRQLFRL